MYTDIESLVMSLPEDILKRKWAGDFSGALKLIERQLEGQLPDMYRRRLEVERDILIRMPGQYPIERGDAIRVAQGHIPDFTEAEFEALELDGWLDYIYVDGRKRYLRSFLATLIKVHPDIARRAGQPIVPNNALLDDAIRDMKWVGRLGYTIRMRGTLRIKDGAFVPGANYRVHLPIPKPAEQISNIHLISTSPGNAYLSCERHPQRTAYFDATLTKNQPFSVEYEFDSDMVYVDPLSANAPTDLVYARSDAPHAADLSEQPPHICFTPYLRSLAAELKGDETDPVRIARRFYDYITTRVRYSFVRDYLLIDNIAEYAALNLKGDCGVQSLLFIALCRIAGIPARWQSGLTATPARAGCHDWAQFYAKPQGWLFCDCSFGGSAHRAGNQERWNFYFGNLDPYRMVANSAYQHEFDPPRKHLRVDPYDNQLGECELEDRGFTGDELDTTYEVISIRRKD